VKPDLGNHGYGQHRRESFQSFYRRSVLSEGCGCAERILDSANRTDAGEALLKLLFLPIGRLFAWRKGTLGKNHGGAE
jgi:hypothetical protein